MRITIAHVHENLYDGEADSLGITTTDGELTILPNHQPLVATLKKGVAVVRTSEDEKTFDIEGGVLEVSNNHATVIL